MKLKITIDNRIYEVDVEVADPGAATASSSSGPAPEAYSVPVTQPVSSGTAPVNGENVCRSPISGTVVRVSAQAGQTIQRGDVLIVLEAMKMETNITAPIDGVVKSALVRPGDSVRGGQVVVEFE